MRLFEFHAVLFAFFLWIAVRSNAKPQNKLAALSEEMITFINNVPNGTWKADKTSRFRSVDDVKKLLGALPEPMHMRNTRRPTITHRDKKINIPSWFSSEMRWPNCPTIPEIHDQSNCGSCWAFGAISAMSDRICIHSDGSIIERVSALDLLSCCEDCGFGCEGGWVGPSWDYWKNEGIVTGGSMESRLGCKPYPFPKCDHHTNETHYGKCPKNIFATPQCRETCQGTYRKDYDSDKIYAESSYNLLHDEKTIMKEIMLHGPVEAAFNVYADFPSYKEGVYQHVTGELLGGHAIRIVGWGLEKGIPYWTVANSWNEFWGDRGYFKILRGRNECGIEASVAAGIPKL